METDDKTITCVDCGREFAFPASEQRFFQDKSFSPPIRCHPCREKRTELRRLAGARNTRKGSRR